MRKLKLHGFNNLTKTLSFNAYDISCTQSAAHRSEYIEYIDKAYNADRLTGILAGLADIIGANILNTARQDYDPQGASVTLLISEEHVDPVYPLKSGPPGPIPEAVVTHLDKSHITVHTYPESHPGQGVGSFRVDIDVSSCGRISPLKALNYLIHSFESDIVVLDYRVRGFTRDVHGKKYFIDHRIDSIQNYLSRDTRKRYRMLDVNVHQENIFHTKMMLREINLDDCLFGVANDALSAIDRHKIYQQVREEMMDIFYGRNVLRSSSLE